MARKKGPTKNFALRMPVMYYDLIDEVAKLRGVDMVDVVVQLIAGQNSALATEIAERRKIPSDTAAALVVLRRALPPKDFAALEKMVARAEAKP
jgi:hypothetical protein